MKNLFKTMMLVAVAAMGFTACSNEAFEEVNPAVESKTYTMTFVADAPNTRTSVAIDGNKATYSWSESDEYLKFLQYTEDKETIYQQKSEEGKVDGTTATFKVSFTNQVDGVNEYYYSAIYPEHNMTSKGSVAAVKVQIPEEQTLTVDSFDPKADLMVAKPIFAEYNSEEIHELQFTRLAAVGRMNIKGLTADEKVLKIEFSFAEDTKFVGSASVDLDNSVLNENPGNSHILTLVANGDYIASAETPVFFTCFPGKYSGAYTIEIETDKANYINTGKSIPAEKALTFSAGDVLRFNISAGVRTEKQEEAPTWVKISSLSELAEGDQVALVGTVGDTNYSLKTDGASSAPSAVDITITDGAIAETSINSITTFYIGKNGSNYILYEDEAQSKWLYCTGSNNGVRSGNNTNKTWTIASHKYGSNFQFQHISTSRFLGIYNKKDWRCYNTVNADNFTNGTGTSDIAIYKLSNGEGGGEEPEPTPDPEPEASIEAATIEDVVAAGGDLEYTPVISNSTSAIDDNIQCDGTVVTKAIVEGGVVLYTVAENTGIAREGWFKLALADDASVTATITVKQLAAEQGGGDEPEQGENKISTLTVATINAVKPMGNGTYSNYSSAQNITVDDVTYSAFNICATAKNSPSLGFAAKTFIQMKKKAAGYFYNTTKTVKSIKVWSHAVDYVVYGGNSKNPSTKVTVATKTTEDVAVKDDNGNAKNATMQVEEYNIEGGYFALVATAACYIYKIEVTYAD